MKFLCASLSREKKTGLLYNKYRNKKYCVSKVLKKKTLNSITHVPVPIYTPTLEFNEEKMWLSVHTQPWQTVEEKWKASSLGRINELKQCQDNNSVKIILDWPLYGSTYGHRLVIFFY